MSEIINVPMSAQSDIQTVTVEIRQLHRQAQAMALCYAIEIGRRLKVAKDMLDHGEWGRWVKEELPFSQSTAGNFMRVFEEYGAAQVSFFGDAKSQALANLSYTKALRLLAIDDETEREAFVETHDVENMSSRELEQAIRERDEALRRAEELEAREQVAPAAEDGEKAELEEALRKAKLLVEEADAARNEAEARAKQNAEKEMEALKARDKAEAEAEKAKEAAKKARDKLKEAQDKPVEIPAEELEKIRAEEAAKAEDAVKAAEARAEQLRRELAAADGDTAVFKAHFEAVQRDFSAMGAVYTRVREKDAERAGKLKAAVKAVLDKLSGDVEGTW